MSILDSIKVGCFVLLAPRVDNEDLEEVGWDRENDEILGKWAEVVEVKQEPLRFKLKNGVDLSPALICNVANSEQEVKQIEEICVGDYVVLSKEWFEGCLHSKNGQSKIGVVTRVPEPGASSSDYQVAAFLTGDLSEYPRRALVKIERFSMHADQPFRSDGSKWWLRAPCLVGGEHLDPKQLKDGSIHLFTSKAMICMKFSGAPNRLFCLSVNYLTPREPKFTAPKKKSRVV